MTDNTQRAEDCVADLDGSLSFYLLNSIGLYRNRRILKMPRHDLNVVDDNLKLGHVIGSMATFVNVDSAFDQLVALCESWGPFSTLLMVAHDWDDKAIWHQSMTLLAEEVMPCLNQHLESLPTEKLAGVQAQRPGLLAVHSNAGSACRRTTETAQPDYEVS